MVNRPVSDFVNEVETMPKMFLDCNYFPRLLLYKTLYIRQLKRRASYLLNDIFYSQILQTDIDNHRPIVESINQQSGDLIRNSEPQVAQLIKSKLDEINQRYTHVDSDTQVRD